MSYSQAPPDFVVFGVPLDDGTVMLYASNELSEIELRHEVENAFLEEEYHLFSPPVDHFFLSTQMRSIVVIHAINYAAAFRALMDSWQPPPRKREPLLPPRKGLNSG